MPKILFSFFLFVLPLSLFGQVDLPNDFSALLENAGLSFVEPLEARYKDIRVSQNDYADYQFAIRSRKEKLEIRYLIYPHREEDPLSYAPHVRAMRLMISLATNQQESIMRGMDVSEVDLEEQFQADWGKVFFFTPKAGFTSWQQCKMLALHREGQGTAFVFFLFDKPSTALDYRFYALQYSAELGG